MLNLIIAAVLNFSSAFADELSYGELVFVDSGADLKRHQFSLSYLPTIDDHLTQSHGIYASYENRFHDFFSIAGEYSFKNTRLNSNGKAFKQVIASERIRQDIQRPVWAANVIGSAVVLRSQSNFFNLGQMRQETLIGLGFGYGQFKDFQGQIQTEPNALINLRWVNYINERWSFSVQLRRSMENAFSNESFSSNQFGFGLGVHL
jgi:hypothetical protein